MTDETITIIGVDEAGRGPLAGPVVAAAVILAPDHSIVGLTDSKKLSVRQRERLELEIKESALAWAIGKSESYEIDEINILQATLMAMQRAIEQLGMTADQVWVDGNQCPACELPVRAIVKGDLTVPSISAASILAKQARDREMIKMDAQFPNYGFAQHKGYPTKQHMAALQRYGVCEQHRRSFAPVRNQLAQFKL